MLGKSKAKYIQSLGQKRQRETEGLFLAEGPKIVTELLQSSPDLIQEIYATNEWLKKNSVAGNVKTIEVSEDELEKISQLKTPNAVLATVKYFDHGDRIETKDQVSIVLDSIRDPGNLGTIIRIADWFGLSQVICSEDSADVYNPKVVQATMGSIARVKVFYTDLLPWLREQEDTEIYATVLDGKNVSTLGKIKQGLIITGNESKGISDKVAATAKHRITIQRKGNAESLNAAVAVGIVLSHVI